MNRSSPSSSSPIYSNLYARSPVDDPIITVAATATATATTTTANSTTEYEYDAKQYRSVSNLDWKKKRIQPNGRPNILTAPKQHHYFASGFIHCCIVRNALHSPMQIQFIFQKHGAGYDDDNVAMVAIKQGGNRTSNYHIFDVGRVAGSSISSSANCSSSTSAIHSNNNNSITAREATKKAEYHCHDEMKLDKKAGNYIGKLRKDKNDRCTYSLYDNKENKEQIGAYCYTFPTFSEQLVAEEGQPPRKMQVAIPSINKEGAMEERASYLKNRLVDSIRRKSQTAVNLFTTKEPNYENGHYRLNFSGRVTTASVKNMQIIDESGKIIVQFGKVGDHRFHLDYK